MQKLTASYNQFTLWSTIILIIAAPAYFAFDLGLRQNYEAEKIHEEYIKKGSFLFAEFCQRCHGPNGGGLTEDPSFVGLPLNKTADMRARDNKDPFIIKTIARGRRGTVMPAWLKEEGGPLDIEDVKMLREFIRDGSHWGAYFDYTTVIAANRTWNYQTVEFDKNQRGKVPQPIDPVAAGKAVFDTPCAVCHNTTAETKIGPGLKGIMSTEGKKLPNGKDVNEENLKEWIQKGSTSYSVPAGKVPMPPYGAQVSETDLKNVIEYLKTLK
jgi:mono/diheme cytochrome c family protein